MARPITRHCPQCQIDNDTLICRGCNRFLSEDPAEVDAHLVEFPLPPGPLQWATAWAHWGDTIACMSHAKWILEQKGQACCNFIYTGPDAHILRFLAAQPWIGDVVAGQYGPDYMRAYSLACNQESEPGAWLPLIRTEAFPDTSAVWPTHPSFCYRRLYRCHPLREASLPPECEAWAAQQWQEKVAPHGHTPVFLLHPSSTWSEPAHRHWPHWREAIVWLLENTPFLYLLTGLEAGFAIDHPRLIDLVGQTPTTMEVFALANRCDGVISTCNCVSLWTIARNLPAIICGNRVMDNFSYFFRRYVDRAPNAWLDVDAPFEAFTALAAGWTVKPRLYADVLFQRDADRQQSQSESDKADGTWIRTRYEALGIVAGRTRDYRPGEIMGEEELQGNPETLLAHGVLRVVDRALMKG